MLIISIIIGLLLSSAGNQSGACDDFPFKQLLKAAPRSRYEYRGQYVNLSYEYSVKIPKGGAAYDGRNEANHSGFGLAFGEAPQGYIFTNRYEGDRAAMDEIVKSWKMTSRPRRRRQR
jgi:hypothetical protein